MCGELFIKVGHDIEAVKNLSQRNTLIRDQPFQVHLKVCPASGTFQAHPIRRVERKITCSQPLFPISTLPAGQVFIYRRPAQGAGNDAVARIQHAKHTQHIGLRAYR